MADIEFDTKMERYLSENHGNLNLFYENIVKGTPAGRAFLISLSRPDIFRIRKADKWDDIKDDDGEFDSPSVLSLIEFLDETAKDYPEDHPLWSLR